jgi:hypothetical protein
MEIVETITFFLAFQSIQPCIRTYIDNEPDSFHGNFLGKVRWSLNAIFAHHCAFMVYMCVLSWEGLSIKNFESFIKLSIK